jgi:hypothetical protein
VCIVMLVSFLRGAWEFLICPPTKLFQVLESASSQSSVILSIRQKHVQGSVGFSFYEPLVARFDPSERINTYLLRLLVNFLRVLFLQGS